MALALSTVKFVAKISSSLFLAVARLVDRSFRLACCALAFGTAKLDKRFAGLPSAASLLLADAKLLKRFAGLPAAAFRFASLCSADVRFAKRISRLPASDLSPDQVRGQALSARTET